LEAANLIPGRARQCARAFDVCIALLLGVLASPILVVVGLAILIDSGRPVFYRCIRVGRDGRDFELFKFRKMRVGATGPPLTVLGNERFTRVGRTLAPHKLDELPQLWNVLRGDMSLVGPRPEAREFVGQVPEFKTILQVRPGITGLSQLAFADESAVLSRERPVEDYMARILPQKLRLDQLYVRRRSLALDLKILAWTAVAVVSGADVAVDRKDGSLGRRRRPAAESDFRSDDVRSDAA